MIRFLSTFRIKAGFDPDETWHIWQEKHVPYVKELYKGYARKYVIGRIKGFSEQESDWFGIVQVWFDDIESARKAMSSEDFKIKDDFSRAITDARNVFVIEEKEIEL